MLPENSIDIIYLDRIYTAISITTYYGTPCFVAFDKYKDYDQHNDNFSFIPVDQCKIYRGKYKI